MEDRIPQYASTETEAHDATTLHDENDSLEQDTDDAIEEVTRSTQDCSLDDEDMWPIGHLEGGGSNNLEPEEICDSEDERATNAEDEVDMLLTDGQSVDDSPQVSSCSQPGISLLIFHQGCRPYKAIRVRPNIGKPDLF